MNDQNIKEQLLKQIKSAATQLREVSPRPLKHAQAVELVAAALGYKTYAGLQHDMKERIPHEQPAPPTLGRNARQFLGRRYNQFFLPRISFRDVNIMIAVIRHEIEVCYENNNTDIS